MRIKPEGAFENPSLPGMEGGKRKERTGTLGFFRLVHTHLRTSSRRVEVMLIG
jgi:hypothetical protein